ncbi:hypothetical protein ACPUVO_13050 [Pseudocolwellia sp. HL-MZ19]|uniref:hypothetical protein n=1 Tax=unclassified Pseudocolwellia TaxID=2848178 RepID=UPI003CF95458
MMHRVIIVIFCSILSCLGLLIPLGILWEALSCLTVGSCQLEYTTNEFLMTVTMILLAGLWCFHFYICKYWINDKAINKKVRMLGALLACGCILITAGQILIVTVPNVCLILYIHFTAPYKKESDELLETLNTAKKV